MFFRITSLIVGQKRLSTAIYQQFCRLHSMAASTEQFEKLPTFAKPTNYKISLKPDLENFTCDGLVKIAISIVEKTNYVKLHSACNELTKISLSLENGKEWNGLKYTPDKRWKTVTVEFPQELEPQNVSLSIEFKTEINKQLKGFYRSSYQDKNGATKYLAATQFESDSARFAFPSFDEPTYKATFDIDLEVDEKLTALSNMEVVRESASAPGKKLVQFNTTPVMSTYLIAFIVGELEYIEVKYGKEQIPIRLYTIPGKKEQGHFSLEVAKKSMEFYEDWFDYKSPLLKEVKMIAIPDFSMGAMENWGLVTYREIRLLIDETTTHRTKTLCALVVAHELAHFWFGNLVTMVWWEELWLKEGFASFMEYLFCEKFYPELKTNLDYKSDVMAAAFSQDSLKSSHPIEVVINDPAELTSIYDSITYEKSNSIIRMLYYYLGEETFREGLRLYIKRFAFKNAVTQDLWTALTDASGQNINQLMSCWTTQMGYPLVSVEDEKLDGNINTGGKRRLRLKQTRYLADGSSDDSVWQIPITIIKSSNTSELFKVLMTQREQEIVLDNIGDDEWVKLNAATSGFYRVQYSEEMLKNLLSAVHSGKLSVSDRYGLISDVYALIKAGKSSASQFLALVAALTNEDEYLIWQVAESGLRSFSNVLQCNNNVELKESLDKFICNIMEPMAKRLGWETQPGEDPHRSQLRALILGSLSKSNHPQTIEQGLKAFDEYQNNGQQLHPDLRGMVFGTVARNNPQGSKIMLKIFEDNTQSNEIQRNALMAALQTPCQEARSKIFDYAFIDGKVRPQDSYLMFMACSQNRKGQEFVWNYFKKNHDKLATILGGPTEGIFQHCFEFSACTQATQEFANELESFYNNEFDQETKTACERTFKQSHEAVLLNANLFKTHYASIANFLSGKQ